MSAYSDIILSDTPLAYWRLGEASGTVAADATGHGHAGTYVNAPTLGAPGALLGDSDTAVTLSAASSQYVDLGNDAALAPATIMSLELWFKTTTQATARLFSRRTDYTDAPAGGSPAIRGYETWLAGGSVSMFFGDGYVYMFVALPTIVNDGKWHHLVVVRDGADARGFLDGVLATNSPGSCASLGSMTNTLTHAVIGQMWTDYFLDGTVDEVAVYAVALSAAQVLAHYQAGISQAGRWGSIAA